MPVAGDLGVDPQILWEQNYLPLFESIRPWLTTHTRLTEHMNPYLVMSRYAPVLPRVSAPVSPRQRASQWIAREMTRPAAGVSLLSCGSSSGPEATTCTCMWILTAHPPAALRARDLLNFSFIYLARSSIIKGRLQSWSLQALLASLLLANSNCDDDDCLRAEIYAWYITQRRGRAAPAAGPPPRCPRAARRRPGRANPPARPPARPPAV